MLAQLDFPATTGGDAAGVVLAVSSDVKGIKDGDRVSPSISKTHGYLFNNIPY